MRQVRHLLEEKASEVYTITPEAPVLDAIRLMAERRVGRDQLDAESFGHGQTTDECDASRGSHHHRSLTTDTSPLKT